MTATSMQVDVRNRGKLSIRGVTDNSTRSRLSTCENVNPNGRIGQFTNPVAHKQLTLPAAFARPQATTFGTDITNIASMPGQWNKSQPLKPQQTDSTLPSSRPLLESAALPESRKTTPTNAQPAEEYKSDISNIFCKGDISFLPDANYMDRQPDLNGKMRMILMDWLIEVHMKYPLRPETLHLTVNLIDRYLSKVPVGRKQLQLVGVSAMFIASKFEEIDPPELHHWVYITDKAYTNQDVLSMEIFMLNTLGFHIVVPTAAHIMPLLLEANGCDGFHKELVQYIVELGILDVRMLQFTPSHVVSAAIFLSNQILGRLPRWTEQMAQSSGHSEASLIMCADLLKQLWTMDRSGDGIQLHAVHKKFSLKDHHSVATVRL